MPQLLDLPGNVGTAPTTDLPAAQLVQTVGDSHDYWRLGHVVSRRFSRHRSRIVIQNTLSYAETSAPANTSADDAAKRAPHMTRCRLPDAPESFFFSASRVHANRAKQEHADGQSRPAGWYGQLIVAEGVMLSLPVRRRASLSLFATMALFATLASMSLCRRPGAH
jgi:hypothetical protein